jgi:hypothetical protein
MEKIRVVIIENSIDVTGALKAIIYDKLPVEEQYPRLNIQPKHNLTLSFSIFQIGGCKRAEYCA